MCDTVLVSSCCYSRQDERKRVKMPPKFKSSVGTMGKAENEIRTRKRNPISLWDLKGKLQFSFSRNKHLKPARCYKWQLESELKRLHNWEISTRWNFHWGIPPGVEFLGVVVGLFCGCLITIYEDFWLVCGIDTWSTDLACRFGHLKYYGFLNNLVRERFFLTPLFLTWIEDGLVFGNTIATKEWVRPR